MAAVQFNLLPDVKLEYVKAQHTKRLIMVIATAVSIFALVLLGFMIVTVDVVQKKNLSNINSDISADTAKLKNTKDINKILTVQNQLNTLTSLHDQKVVASRLFGYLSTITPQAVSMNNLNVDYQANTMVISGQAPTLDAVNVFTDTLKSTKYQSSAAGSTKTAAFSSVVLSSFGRTSTGASFTISLSFDPLIFNSANDINLSVPSGIQTNTTKLFQQVGNK